MRTVQMGGAPCQMAFVPHAAMLAAMRAAQTPSRAFVLEQDDATAIRYATWLAERDGRTVPEVMDSKHGSGVRVIVERDWPEGEPWKPRNNRAKAVIWERGEWATSYLVTKIRTRKGQRVEVQERVDCDRDPRWEPETEDENNKPLDPVVLRVEIPNWDWTPSLSGAAP